MGMKNEPTTLTFLLQALCGRRLRLELRNDVHVEGMLDSVDANMNVTISNASYATPYEHTDEAPTLLYFDLVYIAARHITFVHIPEDVNVSETMELYARRLDAVKYASSGGKRRRT